MTTTTLATAFAALKTLLDGATGVTPPSAGAIRAVVWGHGSSGDVVPALSIQLLLVNDEGGEGNTRFWKCEFKLRIYFTGTSNQSQVSDVAQYIAVVENLIDAWVPQDGIEGGEGGEWSITTGQPHGQGAYGLAERLLTMRVHVVRGTN